MGLVEGAIGFRKRTPRSAPLAPLAPTQPSASRSGCYMTWKSVVVTCSPRRRSAFVRWKFSLVYTYFLYVHKEESSNLIHNYIVRWSTRGWRPKREMRETWEGGPKKELRTRPFFFLKNKRLIGYFEKEVQQTSELNPEVGFVEEEEEEEGFIYFLTLYQTKGTMLANWFSCLIIIQTVYCQVRPAIDLQDALQTLGLTKFLQKLREAGLSRILYNRGEYIHGWGRCSSRGYLIIIGAINGIIG